MGLETPLALLALAAGVLPLIAHRIRRRQLPVVSLPTLQFLKAAAAKKSRSQTLADRLLLALRTLMLLLAAFALTAPFVFDEVTFSDGSLGHIAIVIDDSMSMAAKTDGPSLLSQAKHRAAEVIDSLSEGSTVAIYLGGHPARVAIDPTSNTGEAHRALNRIQESDRGGALSSAVKLAERQLKRTQRTHAAQTGTKLLVLSDFAGPAKLPSAETSSNMARVLEPVSLNAAPGNVYFVDASASQADPSDKSQPQVTVHATVEVQAPAPPAIELHVSHGDHEKTISIPTTPGTHEVDMDLPTSKGRYPRVKLRLKTQDRLAADNARDLVLGASSSIRLLVVNGDPQPGTRNDELFYLRRALSLLPPAMSQVTVTSADSASLAHYDLAGSDVLLLANAPAPSQELGQRITQFVQSGGGLIVAGGNHVAPSEYNACLGKVLPGHLQTASTPPSPLRFEPSTAPLAPAKFAGLDKTRTRRRLLLDTQDSPLLTYSDGSAAIAHRRVGRGNTVLLTTTLDDDWTDLPLRPGYIASVAFVINKARGISTVFNTEYTPGASVILPVPPGARQLEIIGPSGAATRWDVSGLTSHTFTETLQAGTYQTRISGQRGGIRHAPSLSFRVAPPIAESDLRPSRSESLASETGSSQTSAALVKRDRRPLLWLIVGALAIVETVLRLRRHGHSIFRRTPLAARHSSP